MELGNEGAGIVPDVRGLPSAVFETAFTIFVRRPWRLHNAVEGDEFVSHDDSHFSNLDWRYEVAAVTDRIGGSVPGSRCQWSPRSLLA